MDSWFGEDEGHGSLCKARKRLKIVSGGPCKQLGVLGKEAGCVLASG